jgi:hypothetical protein
VVDDLLNIILTGNVITELNNSLAFELLKAFIGCLESPLLDYEHFMHITPLDKNCIPHSPVFLISSFLLLTSSDLFYPSTASTFSTNLYLFSIYNVW